MFILVLVAVAAGLTALGLWQISRGHAKTIAQQQLQQRDQQEVLDITHLATLPRSQWHGRRVQLQGEVLPGRWVALDNRIYQGRAGYEWLLPVKTEAGIVLLNYGWFISGASREVLSPPQEVSVSGGSVDVQVRMMIESPPFQLGDQALEEGWPLRAQWLNYQALEQRYAVAVLPAQAQPTGEIAGAGAQRAWAGQALPPERHYGYAMQWFLLALAWCVLMFWYRRRRYG